jgi:hypothetical protein
MNSVAFNSILTALRAMSILNAGDSRHEEKKTIKDTTKRKYDCGKA